MSDTNSLSPEKKRLAICVFCGSSTGNDPAFAAAACELGRLIADAGHTLVFGGGNIGLMGEVARAARDAGGKVVGILPEFLRRPEIPFDEGAELILVADLQQRKIEMMARSDAFVVLPGGLGTLDELFEVMTMRNLEIHDKPIIVVDVCGYYRELALLFESIVEHGFAPARAMTQTVVPSPATALELLR